MQLKEAWQTDHGCFKQCAQSLSDSDDPTEMQNLLGDLKQAGDCLQVASKFLHRCSLKFLHMLHILLETSFKIMHTRCHTWSHLAAINSHCAAVSCGAQERAMAQTSIVHIKTVTGIVFDPVN